MFVEHPGRCLNHRLVGHQHVRCLLHEGAPHVCEFPEVVAGATGGTYATRPPVPWPPAGVGCTRCQVHHTVPGECGHGLPPGW